jgi:hypothetical protein
MGLKSMIFKLAVQKLAPKVGRVLLQKSQYGKYGQYSKYGYYPHKPKSRGLFGLVKRFFKKLF